MAEDNSDAQNTESAASNQIESPGGANPSVKHLRNLLGLYQNQQYDEAETLAVSITQQFPRHEFGWKILGALLGQKGKKLEALDVNQRVIELAPKDAEAHNNLGITFKELDRLEDAKASYTQAIALKSDYVEAHYNLGNTLQKLCRSKEAEASYKRVIAMRPKFVEAYSNLGVTLKDLGKLEESEANHRKVIALNPGLAKAHNNLGSTLQGLGRLDEAEASHRRAIAIKPEYAEAYSNLGVTLKDLGRLEEAEVSYKQAIVIKPEYAEAHSYLGNALLDLGRLEEAEVSHRRAIAIKPEYSEAHSNLGNTLLSLGRLEEAEVSYKQAIALKSNFVEAMLSLSLVLDFMNKLDVIISVLKNVLRVDADNVGLRAGVRLAVYRFLDGNFLESRKDLQAASKILEKSAPKFVNEKVYYSFLLQLLDWHQNKYFEAGKRKSDQTLYVIGESHSLVSHQLHIQISDCDFFCKSLLIMGCKQWHLGNPNKNRYKVKFESIFCSLPKSSQVLLAIGEIDCRLNSGIIQNKNKHPDKDINEIINSTVENYLDYIVRLNLLSRHDIRIQGVSCPNIDTKNIPKGRVVELVEVIRTFNLELKRKSKEKGFGFLDLHKLTDRGDGMSNAIWHIDDFHISPDGMLQAWHRYASG